MLLRPPAPAAARAALAALFFLAACVSSAPAAPPVVLWHGMGDTCCNPLSLGKIQKDIEAALPGIRVLSLQIGDDAAEDAENGFLMPIRQQIAIACAAIKNASYLSPGYNAIGFSQGAQFLRALLQQCDGAPPMLNLISIGGQQRGVYGMPRCLGANHTLCDLMRKLLSYGALSPRVQGRLVQAQYWDDPFKHEEYLLRNVFLPDLNNEFANKSSTYKQRLLSLKSFVLVMFTRDSMVQPRESSHFEFYELGQDKLVVPLSNSSLYTEDWLGLRQLDAGGRLLRLECEGDHLQMPAGWFEANIIPMLA